MAEKRVEKPGEEKASAVPEGGEKRRIRLVRPSVDGRRQEAQREIAEARGRLAALLVQEAETYERLAEVRERLAAAATQEVGATQRLHLLEERAAAAEGRLQAAQAAREALMGQMNQEQALLQAQHQRWLERVEGQLDRLESLGREAAVAEGRKAAADAEAVIARRQLDAAQAALAKAEESLAVQSQALAEREGERAALEPLVEGLRAESAQLQEQVAALRTEHEALQKAGRSLTPFEPPQQWPDGVWEPKRWSHDLPLFVHMAIARYSNGRGMPQHQSVTQAILDTFPHDLLTQAGEEAMKQLTAKYQRRGAPRE